MTGVPEQHANLVRHLIDDHGEIALPRAESLSDLMERHRWTHPHDLEAALPHRSHLVAVLKGETANINHRTEEP